MPFVAVTLVATLFYTRALRDERWSWWLAASLAASAAIFIRQFGMALVGGIAARSGWRTRAAGSVSRGICSASCCPGQPCCGSSTRVGTTDLGPGVLLSRQRVFFWGGGFLKNVPWRPFVLSEYAAFLLPPLVFVAAVALVRELRGRRLRAVTARSNLGGTLGGVVAWTILFVASVFYASRLLAVDKLMPFLPWYFEILKLLGPKIQLCATVLAVSGGILFARLFARRYAIAANRPTLNHAVLDASTGVSFAMALVFFVFGDKDVLIFLPFAAIAVGRQVESVLMAYCPAVAVLCLGLLAGTAIWTREDLCRNEAIWTLAERVHATGVPPGKISPAGNGAATTSSPLTPARCPPSRARRLPIFSIAGSPGEKHRRSF